MKSNGQSPNAVPARRRLLLKHPHQHPLNIPPSPLPQTPLLLSPFPTISPLPPALHRPPSGIPALPSRIPPTRVYRSSTTAAASTLESRCCSRSRRPNFLSSLQMKKMRTTGKRRSRGVEAETALSGKMELAVLWGNASWQGRKGRRTIGRKEKGTETVTEDGNGGKVEKARRVRLCSQSPRPPPPPIPPIFHHQKNPSSLRWACQGQGLYRKRVVRPPPLIPGVGQEHTHHLITGKVRPHLVLQVKTWRSQTRRKMRQPLLQRQPPTSHQSPQDPRRPHPSLPCLHNPQTPRPHPHPILTLHSTLAPPCTPLYLLTPLIYLPHLPLGIPSSPRLPQESLPSPTWSCTLNTPLPCPTTCTTTPPPWS